MHQHALQIYWSKYNMQELMIYSFNLWKNNILHQFLNFRKKQQEV